MDLNINCPEHAAVHHNTVAVPDSQPEVMNHKMIKMKKIRITIIDDHPAVRKGVRYMLEENPDIIISGECGCINDSLAVISETEPDLLIIDIESDGYICGSESVRSIRESFPDILILVMSMHEDAQYAEKIIGCGADGFLYKREAADKIHDAVNTVVSGRTYISGTDEKNIRIPRGSE